jgi:hypothetical protein
VEALCQFYIAGDQLGFSTFDSLLLYLSGSRFDCSHTNPDELAAQLSLLINGAFVSSQMFSANEATPILLATSRALIASARGR